MFGGFPSRAFLEAGGEAAPRDVGGSPRRSLTSQVSQRPQHASVVTRSPLQPGFLARKVNSRTAQPTKVRRSMAEVLSVPPQLASSRRSREPRIAPWSFMLRQKGEKRRARRRERSGGLGEPAQSRRQEVQAHRLSSSRDGPSSPQTHCSSSSLSPREDGEMRK